MESIIKILTHIFPYIILGYFIGKLSTGKLFFVRKLTDYLVNVSIFFLIPVFILLVMWQSASVFGYGLKVIGFTLGVIFFGSFFALLFSKIYKKNFKDVCLPIVFMNSAYLAIPVNMLYFGKDSLSHIIIYNVIVTLLHFSLGVWWVSQQKGEILKMPFLYSAILGILLNILAIPVPSLLINIKDIMLSVVMPSMLILVGYELSNTHFVIMNEVFVGVCLRMFGGFLVGLFLAEIFNMDGIARSVCILTSSMPSAVNTYILSKKYSSDAAFAAGMIFIGLLVSIFFIPFVVNFVR